jgi:hypothetical protein
MIDEFIYNYTLDFLRSNPLLKMMLLRNSENEDWWWLDKWQSMILRNILIHLYL